ncbi:MAG: trigger factor [Gammaproteobacteria bacterium]
MSVSVEQSSAVGRRVTITIPGESIESEVEKRLLQYRKNAKIKGFRPGKAPAKIVRREYGPAAREDVLGELVNTHYAEAVQSEALAPVGSPTIESGETGADGSFTFTAELEVYPELEPTGLDRLSLKRPQIEIGDADVEVVLERLRRQRQEWAAVGRRAGNGDEVSVNFEGSVEGEPFEGGQGENVTVTLGSNEMMPGFEAGLEGISGGETRALDLAFPENYRVTNLAGRPVHFEVTAVEVRESRLPALDEEFAAAFGCAEGGVEQLRERVRMNMSAELDARIRDDLQHQVDDQLVDANPVEVPRALVDREIERQQRRLLQRLGIKSEGVRIPELPREPYEEAAKRQIRLGLILNALIQREEFRPDPARVEKHIEAVCAELEDPTAGARELRADSEAMRNVEALVLEDMIYDWLIEQAAVTDEPMEFIAYMEPKESTAQAGTEDTDAAQTDKESETDD